ncbi:hypothetical protein JCM6882_007589 [Rhodosporidiobolus microsporus]
MDVDVLSHLAASAGALVRHPALTSPDEPPFGVQLPPTVLSITGAVDSVEEALQAEGCSTEAAASLDQLLRSAVAALTAEAQRCFADTALRLRATLTSQEIEMCIKSEQAVKQWYMRKQADGVLSCRQRLLDEVRLARQRHHSSFRPPPPAATPSEPGLFTPSILTILNSAFAVRDSVSRAERRELARATGLNERQVLSWFANQRQRRGKKDKTASQASHSTRASPYAHPRQPSTLSHHSHLPPVRTVSSSSTASSASLVSYATTGGSDDDISVDAAPEAPYALPPPLSATAAFASFASQFQVAPLPLPPPPTFFNPHPPAEGESEVPMMEYTSPMPITASFSALGVGVAPSSSSLPGAIDFSQPLFLPPVSHTPSPPSQALSASPTAEVEDGASMVDWTDAESFFSSSSCGAVPVAPAPTPTAGETSSLDGWMDATFYENLLSSLGLTSSSTCSSSGGDSSAPFGGADAALPFDGLDLGLDGMEGGGLTLSMEAVRAEAGVQVGGGAGGW